MNIWVVVASRRAFTPEAAAAHRATESRGWKSLEAPPPSPRPRRPRAREMEGQQGIDALVSGAVGRVRDAVQGSRHAPMASGARASATDLAIDGRAAGMEWRGGALTARRMVTASAQSNRRDRLVPAPLARRQGCRFAAFQPAISPTCQMGRAVPFPAACRAMSGSPGRLWLTAVGLSGPASARFGGFSSRAPCAARQPRRPPRSDGS